MLCLFELILLFILKAKPSPPTYCSVLACELTEQNVQNLFSVQTKCLQSDMLCKKTPFKFLPHPGFDKLHSILVGEPIVKIQVHY